jgi:hypothetical protein
MDDDISLQIVGTRGTLEGPLDRRTNKLNSIPSNDPRRD